MIRATSAALFALALMTLAVSAQDAATRKATRAIHAQEKEILHRVTTRIEYDKKLDGATVKVEVQPGGVVTLGGSMPSEVARDWALALVENTSGVTTVVDQMAVVKNVKVYDARSEPSLVEVKKPVPVPAESKLIVKP